MSVFVWDKRFETGIDTVDQQHQRLVDMTNTFGQMLTQDAVHIDDIRTLLEHLIDYANIHFKAEEALMDQRSLSQEHLADHKQEHRQFLEDVLALGKEYEETAQAGQDLFDFLKSWLVFHILGTDMKMASFLDETCSTDSGGNHHRGGEATDLLFSALDNLFQQVSKRNRDLKDLNQTLEDKVTERTEELLQANLRLQELASTDVLTGLFNRRQAMHLLKQLWQESNEDSLPLACLMVDADNFKEINDTYGHDAGDRVLQKLAQELKDVVRTDDIVSRLGGDEFLIICPGTDLEGALTIAQITHKKINDLTVNVPDGGSWKGSISVGVGIKDDSMQKPEDMIKAADTSVYSAKSAGRNCIRCDQAASPTL